MKMQAAWSSRQAGKGHCAKRSFRREKADDVAQKLNAFLELFDLDKLIGFMRLLNRPRLHDHCTDPANLLEHSAFETI